MHFVIESLVVVYPPEAHREELMVPLFFLDGATKPALEGRPETLACAKGSDGRYFEAIHPQSTELLEVLQSECLHSDRRGAAILLFSYEVM